MSSILERQRQRAQGSRNRGVGSGSQRQSRFDEWPPPAPGRSSQHRSSSSAQRPRVEQRVEPAPSSSRRRAREDSDAEDDIPLIRRRTSNDSQPAPAAAARSAGGHQAPTREVAEAAPTSSSVVGPRFAYPDGFSYARTECQAAMLQGMQNFVPPADRLRAKGHIQQHGGHAALIKLMDVSILGELEMFQDAVAVAAANTTTDIFNEVRGRVLGVRADFPVGELAFFEGEEIDADGKSLAPPADTRVKLKWELNDEGLPVWPPSVAEEGEDTDGLPSFDAWVADPPDVPAEPSSTPPSAPTQPASDAAPTPTAPSPVPFPAHSSPDRSSPVRSAVAPNDASTPVDLTDE
ncbi:hypothetical protein SLEP1_g14862 [Rubroshorea leprosula]|uniref:Uncharacterized protein n=1 Tax=Rubroshorea leprosula TaxID=152421 RepID=A0AAV5IPX2_9ROSI|nr:hypothetical protein SLEP1_g14862 [Rubroshorea leprosula]